MSSTRIAHDFRSTVRPLERVRNLSSRWQELERGSDCSFYQSWHWMSIWLEHFADRENVQVFECWEGDALVGLAAVGIGNTRRRLVVRAKQFVLNESADDSRNMMVERNELLCLRGLELEVTREFVSALNAERDWDELKISYGTTSIWRDNLNTGLKAVIDDSSMSWVANLHPQIGIDELLAHASSKRRYQIRRSLKEFEKEGALSIQEASNVQEALVFFRALGDLHTRKWRVRSQQGSFARLEWVRFHEWLIDKCFHFGLIQLLKVNCGNEPVGYIYNLIWRRSVLVVQTGFQLYSSNVLMPGYVSHLLAMAHNATIGMLRYDFQPGHEEYKRVLAQPGPEVASIRFQRPRLKFMVEDAAVRMVRSMRNSRIFGFDLSAKRDFRRQVRLPKLPKLLKQALLVEIVVNAEALAQLLAL